MGFFESLTRRGAGGPGLPALLAASTGVRRDTPPAAAPVGVKSDLAYQHIQEWLATGGAGSSVKRAAGLPAWLAVMKRLADGVGMSPLVVYRGDREDRARADDHPVAELLRAPGDGYNAFTFRADVAASLAAVNNAYVRKYKARGRVAELLVLDPRDVTVERVNGRIVFHDASEGRTETRTSGDIIHIRGVGLPGELVGVNPVESLRRRLDTGLRRERYESSYFDQDARPGTVVTFPQDVGVERIRAFLAQWNADHQGAENAGKTAGLGGGASLEVIPPISFADAEFVEAEQLNLRTIAGLYGVPAGMVGDGPVTEEDRLQFVMFALGPMFSAIELALSADRDLFPPGGEPVFVEHNADRLLRGVTTTRFAAHKDARQGGWKSINEIRAEENLPPVDGGDTVQLTPVGGPVDRTAPDDTAPVPGADQEAPGA